VVDWTITTPAFLISYLASQVIVKTPQRIEPQPEPELDSERIKIDMSKQKQSTAKSNTMNPADFTAQDLITGNELNQAVLRKVLLRHSVVDPDAFLMENRIECSIFYRDVDMRDGTTAMMASVNISKVTPKNVQHQEPQSHKTQTDSPQDS
jgi:hypothetical protein